MKRFLLLLCLLLSMAAVSAASADVVISEVMALSGEYLSGNAYDWIELHNTDSKKADISGYCLSDDENDLEKWSFPSGASINAGGYILVYCTGEEHKAGKGNVFYSDFKISSSGETLFLSDGRGKLLQSLELGVQYGNISFGVPGGGEGYLFLSPSTPGRKNTSRGYSERTEQPLIATAGGIYEGSVTAAAAAPADCVLRYTLDGSEPAESSKLYMEALAFTSTTVFRVKAFADGLLPSVTATATYLIDDPSPVPVISLATDEKYLFDSKTGALVKGNGGTPNYEKELEYPVNIEYFNAQGLMEINQIGTFTAAGHSARVNSQKSIAVYARKAYGEERFDFNPFPNRDYPGYKSLLIRSTNSDAWSTRLRDPVISSAADGLGILYQDALPVVLYINGEYWGHYNLREKINKYFVAQWEGIADDSEIDSIDILARTGIDDYVQNGSNDDWLELMEFCRMHDLNETENLAYVTDRLDVESLFTHTAFEMIIGNSDMTNIRIYRVPGGKWKYLLFDVEAGFLSLDEIPISYYMKSVSEKRARFQHVHFAALMQVPAMRHRFLERCAEVLKEGFLWPEMESRFLAWENVLEQLIPRHLSRWKGNLSLYEWRANVKAVKYYAKMRPAKVIDMICDALGVSNAEREACFGEVTALLDKANSR